MGAAYRLRLKTPNADLGLGRFSVEGSLVGPNTFPSKTDKFPARATRDFVPNALASHAISSRTFSYRAGKPRNSLFFSLLAGNLGEAIEI